MITKLHTYLRRKWNRYRTKDWHRNAIGGSWDVIGKLQFDFLVSRGLKPEHYFLDIGCGSLRGGVRFIDYLEKGHYYGIEKERALLRAARRVELKRYQLNHKNPRLYLIDDFDLKPLGKVEFDFMLAQSVFTHLTPEMIQLCLERVMPSLKPDGTFYSTFRIAPNDVIDIGAPHKWRKNERRDVYYPVRLFEEMSEKLGISMEYIGEWGHPAEVSRMLAFRRK